MRHATYYIGRFNCFEELRIIQPEFKCWVRLNELDSTFVHPVLAKFKNWNECKEYAEFLHQKDLNEQKYWSYAGVPQ